MAKSLISCARKHRVVVAAMLGVLSLGLVGTVALGASRRHGASRVTSLRRFSRIPIERTHAVGRVGTPGRHLAGFQLFDQGPLALGKANRGRGPHNGASPPAQFGLRRTGGRRFVPHHARVRRSAVSSQNVLPGGTGQMSLGPLTEVPSFRTEYSDTYASTSGIYQAKVYTRPVNYQTSTGSWQPIDDSLVASGSGFVNKADAYQATLPSSLGSGQVRIAVNGASASMQLDGAPSSATASVSGSTALYRGALPGIDASYQTLPGILKESLSLSDASAGGPITFTLALSAGLHAVEHDGTIVLQNSAGKTVIGMPAPYMVETPAAGAPPAPPSDLGHVAVSMSQVSGGIRVIYTPDQSWLQAPGRAFPVTLDPSFVPTSEHSDCSLFQSAPTTSYCAGYTYTLVSNASNGIGRTIMDFSAIKTALPSDAQVLGAAVSMNVTFSTASNGFVVVPMTEGFTPLATWNTYDGVNNWTFAADAPPPYSGAPAPGGAWEIDYLNGGVCCAWQATGTAPATSTGEQVGFDVTPMAQSWVDGSRAVPDLMLSENNMGLGQWFSIANYASGSGPSMTIEYTPRLGSPQGSTTQQTSLTDRMNLGVNVADGNLTVANNDLSVQGTGLNLSIPRTYNSLGATQASFGMGWGSAIDGDLPYVTTVVTDAAYLAMPDGGFYRFDADPNNPGGFLDPAGLDATMCDTATQSGCPGLVSGAGLEVVFQSGEKWEFGAIGGEWRLIADVDNNGNEITYQHNGPSSQVSQSTDTQGRTVTYNYTNGYISSIVDNAGGRTTYYTQNAAGQLTTYKDAAGNTTTYEYGIQHTQCSVQPGSNELTQITDPLGEITQMCYDASGRVTAIKRITNNPNPGDGDTTTYSYGPPTDCPGSYGETIETDPDNNHTRYCYDTHDQVTTTIDATGYRTADTYDLDDHATADTPPTNGQQNTGGTSTVCYDSNACAPPTQQAPGCERTIAQTAPPSTGSPSQTAASDTAIYPSSCPYLGATGAPRSFEPNSTTVPNGTNTSTPTTMTYGYDNNGNLYTITDQLTSQNKLTIHHVLTNQCTAPASCFGLVDYTISADGAQTNYTYDSHGNPKTATPPSIPPHPLGQITYNYDPNTSRLLSMTDGNGNQTQYQYDSLDRVKLVTYNDSSTTTYNYDADGNLKSAVDSKTGTISYGYDQKNRLTSETDPGAAGQPATTTTYGYDGADNMTSVTDAGGTVTYQPDADNRLWKVFEPGVANPTVFAYDVDSRRICTTYPNGVAIQEFYDYASNVKSIKAANGTGAGCNASSSDGTPTGNVFANYTYTYNQGTVDTGLRQSLQINNGTPFTYYYDVLNRLDETTGGSLGQPLFYSYDGDGNLQSKTNVNGTVSSFTYNGVDQLTNTGYNYDAAGNMLARPDAGGTTGLTYNPREQTATMKVDSAAAQSLSYLPGAGQTRPAQIGNQPGGGKAPSLETNVLGISAQEAAVQLLGHAAVTYYTRDTHGSLLSERTPSSGRYYYVEDANGSVVALTDANGNVANTYTYDPWGSTMTSTGSAPNSFGFDEGFQSLGGLYHFGQRYYDPTSGSWTQEDPVAHPSDPAQSDPYGFAGDDPINSIDPAGTFSTPRCVAACITAYAAAISGILLSCHHCVQHHDVLSCSSCAKAAAELVTATATFYACLWYCIKGGRQPLKNGAVAAVRRVDPSGARVAPPGFPGYGTCLTSSP